MSRVIEKIKTHYNFILSEFDYKIVDEHSTQLLTYVRYSSKIRRQIISIGIDFRESYFGITFWYTENGCTEDKNMLKFNDYLKYKKLNISLKNLETNEYNLKYAEDIIVCNAKILKKYGVELISGQVNLDSIKLAK